MIMTFIARMVNQKGQVVHGEYRAILDPEKARRRAEKVFPGCQILAVYPKDMGLRWRWAQKYWLKGGETMKELRALAWLWMIREVIHILFALGATGLALWFLYQLVGMYQ